MMGGKQKVKKIIAIIAEIIPLVSAVVSYPLLVSSLDSKLVRLVIAITFLCAFLGFVFFFIGRGLAKDDKAVRILGIFDWLATIYVIAIYVIAIFIFGL